MSARDTVLLGDCLAAGRAAGPTWTHWHGMWHLACLAVAPDWIMSVLQRYPARLGLGYGKNACQQVAAQLLRGGGDGPA